MTKTPEQLAEEYTSSITRESERFIRSDVEYAFYAGYQAAQQWISVKERLPEESTHCVIRIDDGEYQVAWRENGHWIMFNPCCIYNSQLNNVTHWMPLPAAPKEEV